MGFPAKRQEVFVGDWSENPRFGGFPLWKGVNLSVLLLATSFCLSRTVIKHQLNDKTWKSKIYKNEKWKLIFLPSNLIWPFLLELAHTLALHPVQCSAWRPLLATSLTICAWWNSDLLFNTKSALLDVILTASLICLSRHIWKLPTTSIEKICFSPLPVLPEWRVLPLISQAFKVLQPSRECISCTLAFILSLFSSR